MPVSSSVETYARCDNCFSRLLHLVCVSRHTAHRYDKSDGMATYAMLFGMALMAFSLFALGE